MLVYTSEWVENCDGQQSSYISDGTDKRKLLGERADGLRSSWMFMSANLTLKGKKLGDFETVLTEIQDFMRGGLGQHLILGGHFRIDRISPRGRVDTTTENSDGHKRYPARTGITRCCGRNGTWR